MQYLFFMEVILQTDTFSLLGVLLELKHVSQTLNKVLKYIFCTRNEWYLTEAHDDRCLCVWTYR